MSAAATLVEALNKCKSPEYVRICELRPIEPYTVLELKRTNSRFGPAVVATLDQQHTDGEKIKIYLPDKYRGELSDERVDEYNKNSADPRRRISLVYTGTANNIEFVCPVK